MKPLRIEYHDIPKVFLGGKNNFVIYDPLRQLWRRLPIVELGEAAAGMNMHGLIVLDRPV